jgi:hypothetical protein
MTDGDHPRHLPDTVISAMTLSVFQVQFPTFSLPRFLSLMRSYGFTDAWDLELLTAKYFRNLSLRDIAEECHWTSKSEVQRRLKKLHAMLKERGFEKELPK